MSVYCRESLFQYLKLDADDIFTITIEGIKFYEKLFGYEFPFSKYDQIFCPEYNGGAMENPGAVTYNDELYIFKEDVVIERRTRRALCISHELSHMWFGNLVTMKWWNDLWLNEAFADLVAHYCISELEKSSLAYLNLAPGWFMLFKKKCLAYVEDQYQTTHPVSGECLNTEEADTNFDMITYAKGASSLKQLMSLMGADMFSEALKVYFKKYEWSNTELKDFIETLQTYYKPIHEGYPDDLLKWQKSWLSLAGLNECKLEWDLSSDSSQMELKIHQNAVSPQYGTLRHHKMKIAFFNENADIYDVKDVVIDNKEITMLKYHSDKIKPSGILLNYEDEDYIKIRINDDSLTFFIDNVWKLKDHLSKALVWESIWNLHRDCMISSYEFLISMEQYLPHEESVLVLSCVFNWASEAIEKFTPLDERVHLNRVMFDQTSNLLMKCPPDNIKNSIINSMNNNSQITDHKKPKESQTTIAKNQKAYKDRLVLLKDMLIKFAVYDATWDNLKILIDWIDDKETPLCDYKLSTANKWDIVVKLCSHPKLTNEIKLSYIDKGVDEDKTDRSKLMMGKCTAIIAEQASREKLWESFVKNDIEPKLSVKLVAAMMSGFNLNLINLVMKDVDGDDTKEVQKYYDSYFDDLLTVFDKQGGQYAKAFFINLFPKDDRLDEYVKKMDNLIIKAPKEEVWLNKLLREYSDDLKRRIKAYKASEEFGDNLPDIKNEDFYFDDNDL